MVRRQDRFSLMVCLTGGRDSGFTPSASPTRSHFGSCTWLDGALVRPTCLPLPKRRGPNEGLRTPGGRGFLPNLEGEDTGEVRTPPASPASWAIASRMDTPASLEAGGRVLSRASKLGWGIKNTVCDYRIIRTSLRFVGLSRLGTGNRNNVIL